MPKRATSYRAWLGNKLSDPKIAAKYLSAALDDSPEMFLKALRKVAEVRQITKVAEEAGISRESLYRMTCETGNPTYTSLGGILRALGLTFVIVPMEKARPRIR
jgi:probable addiction module antidote protein